MIAITSIPRLGAPMEPWRQAVNKLGQELLSVFIVLPFITLMSNSALAVGVCGPFENSIEEGISADVAYLEKEVVVGGTFTVEIVVKDAGRGVEVKDVTVEQGTAIVFRKALLKNGKPNKIVGLYQAIVQKDIAPGEKYAKLLVTLNTGETVEWVICFPVGSNDEGFLDVRLPKTISLTWGETYDFFLHLQNTYPYAYFVTDIKFRSQSRIPCDVQTPMLSTPTKIQKSNSDLMVKVAARNDWKSLVGFSPTLAVAELHIDYNDEYDRRFEDKRIEFEIIVSPPTWLLLVIAAAGGTAGGLLAFVRRKGNVNKSLWGYLLFGVVGGVVLYMLLHLGDISVFVGNLDLSLSSNTGVVAALLGLLGGWQGDAILERISSN